MFLASQKNLDIFEIGGIVPTMVQGHPNHPKWFGMWYWPWTQPPKYSLVGLIMIIWNFGWTLYPKDSQGHLCPHSHVIRNPNMTFRFIFKGVGRLEVKFFRKIHHLAARKKRLRELGRSSLVLMSTWEPPKRSSQETFMDVLPAVVVDPLFSCRNWIGPNLYPLRSSIPPVDGMPASKMLLKGIAIPDLALRYYKFPFKLGYNPPKKT